jgi:hypothetical protein
LKKKIRRSRQQECNDDDSSIDDEDHPFFDMRRTLFHSGRDDGSDVDKGSDSNDEHMLQIAALHAKVAEQLECIFHLENKVKQLEIIKFTLELENVTLKEQLASKTTTDSPGSAVVHMQIRRNNSRGINFTFIQVSSSNIVSINSWRRHRKR